MYKKFIVVFSKIPGENIIISNGHILKFKLIPYFSKSFAKFSPSISSKFRFYLYFNHLIDFLFFIHVNLNKNASKICRIPLQNQVQMHKIFHQFENIGSSYEEQYTTSSWYLSMGNHFTTSIVTCYLPFTILGQ